MTAIAIVLAVSPVGTYSQDLRVAADQWPPTVSVFRRHAKGSGIPPMVRMSVALLRALVEPHGGMVQHGPVSADGNVTQLLVSMPPCPRGKRR